MSVCYNSASQPCGSSALGRAYLCVCGQLWIRKWFCYSWPDSHMCGSWLVVAWLRLVSTETAYLCSTWSLIASQGNHSLFLWWRQDSKWEWKCWILMTLMLWTSPLLLLPYCLKQTSPLLLLPYLSKANHEGGPNSRSGETDSTSSWEELQAPIAKGMVSGRDGESGPFYSLLESEWNVKIRIDCLSLSVSLLVVNKEVDGSPQSCLKASCCRERSQPEDKDRTTRIAEGECHSPHDGVDTSEWSQLSPGLYRYLRQWILSFQPVWLEFSLWNKKTPKWYCNSTK